MDKNKKLRNFTRNVIFTLDLILAFSIIAFSYRILKTEFGFASVIFGFIMLAISVVLRLMQKW